MQIARGKTVANGRKAKLANSYQELLDEFSNKELKSVGNYNLGRLIGKGSFGKVYLASHKLINGSKVVLKSANKDDSNLAREIHHHRQFVHPHIARLYEVIVTESLVWLALEYCPGDELYNYLLKHGPLPIAKVQKIFAQLVGAVAYVHQQSCVHRDLKLENILFDKNENVKLVDFGFTREYEGRTNHLQTFCGTICYAAPEMLKGEKYAGEKVDVWSLGIILYALLCGELPFDDDDDGATRTKILTEKPAFPEHLPADAVSLMEQLLSKRPFPRPSLPDILSHPFLAEHAPAQQAILEVHQPSPFTTGLEKDCLHRMKAAGVDIDMVIESVLAQKCDALSGWWTLLLAKERRKLARRERKRTEREAENKSSRRVSAASSRLERMAPSLHDVDEDGGLTSHFISSRSRGRSSRRSTHYYTDFNFQELATQFGDPSAWNGLGSPDEIPPTPIDKDSIRSASTSTHRRPVPPPKEGIIRSARSRGSTLHLVTTSEALGHSGHHHHSHTTTETNGNPKSRRKPSQAIIAHWKNWTHWIFENTTKRRRWHDRKSSRSTPDLHKKDGNSTGKDSKASTPRPQTNPTSGLQKFPATAGLPKNVVANGHLGNAIGSKGSSKAGHGQSRQALHPGSDHGTLRTSPAHPQLRKRQSLSPAPLTPTPVTPRSSTMRRSSAGLRGRKSTSSSVSSVRSMHRHRHSHSKASSTSSAGSVSVSKNAHHRGASPQHSVKLLPATPTATSFPSNIRLVRAAPSPLNFYNEGMPHNEPAVPGSPNPFSSGVLFARRKKNIFKGPSLNPGGVLGSGHRSSSAGGHSRSASGSAIARRSGEVTIQEEDEDHEAEAEVVEEVENFTPVITRPGEIVEERIIEADEEPEVRNDASAAAIKTP
ncbi:MAP/microtubule affinity-regulating kinase [Emericellopsis atlantica]|uniref:MAP/microtubule affinity-regulating kinase n=1 Tax=Emericellopsis atlantica TaxID=2614577 RepID=A0A9P8CJP3_9HYPO|nr:MAP/microtubule affinity-regulating kinase [Emericellopsis atlantica]KAG9249553.1 MAP/microtubule affinity-regulating kinase [Emericellopsis atlantica]